MPRSKENTLIQNFKTLIAKLVNIFLQIDYKIALKITITAITSLYICLEVDSFLKHPEYITSGLWCVISSIVVLQANLGGTYKAIWNRFIGVLIGSAIGAFFAFRWGADVEVLGIAIFITIAVCSLIGIPDSYRMASLSVAIIMIPWKLHPETDPWVNAFFRFFDTCLGFFVAIIISHLLWPSQALTKMRLNMVDIFNSFRRFFEYILIPDDSPNKSPKIIQSLYREIDEAFLQNRSFLEESKVELFVRMSSIGFWLDLIGCQDRLWESLRAMQEVYNSKLESVFDEGLKRQVNHIVEVIDFAFKEIAIKLKTEKSNFDFPILQELLDSLQEELIRFRSTHTIKKYNLEVVEDYFVFFHELKQILSALLQFNQLLIRLQNGEKRALLDD